MSWTYYPAFIATVISVIGLTQIAVKHHDDNVPRTLSELAAAEARLLQRFQLILAVCGLLFACTILGFIAPNLDRSLLVVCFGVLMVGGELIAALMPANKKTLMAHKLAAQIMAVGMLGLVVLFALGLSGLARNIELALTVVMAAAALLTLLDKKRYIIYELGFIFTSHFSILVAALAAK